MRLPRRTPGESREESNAERWSWQSHTSPEMKVAMGRNSWILGARGIVAILFGLYALLVPGGALATLILVFGICLLLEGILSIVAALRVRDRGERSLPIVLEGIVCIAVGLLALLWPDAAALTWLYLVSGFAVVSGILHMAGTIQLRKEFAGEWALILNGALTTLFGIVMILLPLAGLLALIWLIGAYSLFFGALLLAVAVRLRARWRAQGPDVRPAGPPIGRCCSPRARPDARPVADDHRGARMDASRRALDA